MRKLSEIITKNMKIYVRNNDISKAYRILNKKLHTEGFFKEIREKQFFKSKGERKRDALRAAKARWNKKKKRGKGRMRGGQLQKVAAHRAREKRRRKSEKKRKERKKEN